MEGYDLVGIGNVGFLLFFAVAVVHNVIKYGPDFLTAWKDFSMAIKDLGNNVADNTDVTRRQYEESLSVKEQLKNLNDKLNSRDAKFDKQTSEHAEMVRVNKEDHAEIRRLFGEVETKVNKLLKEK